MGKDIAWLRVIVTQHDSRLHLMLRDELHGELLHAVCMATVWSTYAFEPEMQLMYFPKRRNNLVDQ
jgi:hypothetical protein